MKKIFAAGLLSCLCLAGTPAAPLPKGYTGITLGMSVDAAKDALQKNGAFGYRGDRDVSLLPGQDRLLIETDAQRVPGSYFTRCYFQFYEEQLSVMTFNLNRERVDYYSVFTALTKKYGEPAEFSPERCVWRDSGVVLSLEKPLTLKYSDAAVQRKLAEGSSVERSAGEKSTSDFLDSL